MPLALTHTIQRLYIYQKLMSNERGRQIQTSGPGCKGGKQETT